MIHDKGSRTERVKLKFNEVMLLLIITMGSFIHTTQQYIAAYAFPVSIACTFTTLIHYY